MKRLHAWVSGRVQGVWFRAWTQRKARELGLTGWVRNLPDGRVEVVAEGPQPQLEAFARWLWQGSPLSRVSDVQLAWHPATGAFKRFEVVE